MFKPTTILHPTDYSDNSAYAFKVALGLAEQHGAMLYVAHVVESLGPELVTAGEAEAVSCSSAMAVLTIRKLLVVGE